MKEVAFWLCSARDGGFIMETWLKDQPELEPSLHGAVCVIEGDQGIRKSLYMLLTTLGVRVVTFSTAEDFLGRVNAERPCFVITELDLPGRGGFELIKILYERGIHVPAIGLTGEVDRDNSREASELGFLELIEKPFVYWSVVERVQQTLGDPG